MTQQANSPLSAARRSILMIPARVEAERNARTVILNIYRSNKELMRI
jgi:hypothetical protein